MARATKLTKKRTKKSTNKVSKSPTSKAAEQGMDEATARLDVTADSDVSASDSGEQDAAATSAPAARPSARTTTPPTHGTATTEEPKGSAGGSTNSASNSPGKGSAGSAANKRDPADRFNERAQNLLKALVEQYLDSGQPVGSKTLAQTPAVDVSAATVRNIMADLEAQGMVISPHTSAGKVPTQQGLRLFVDSLISVQPLDNAALSYLRNELHGDLSPHELVESASNLLSHVSSLAGLVTMPRPEQVELRQVEFLPLSGNRVLAILVVNEREVQNRVIEAGREYSQVELTQAANFINRNFAGRSLLAIRTGILDSMQSDKDRMDKLMQTALDVGSKAFVEEDEQEYVVSGERNLMNFLSSSEQVRDLLDAFTEKGAIVHLLDRCVETEGVQLFIGEESGYQPLDGYSVITAPYESNGQVAGVLGVIGPTRMQYQKVIPLVDVTARLLGSAMNFGRGT